MPPLGPLPLTTSLLFLLLSIATSLPEPPSGSYLDEEGTCNHDAMLAEHERMAIKQVAVDYGEEFHRLFGYTRPGDSAKPKIRAYVPPDDRDISNYTAFLSVNRQTLRLTIDTSLLADGADTDSGYYRACYSTGQSYIVGNGAGTCSSSVTTDCTGTCTADDVITAEKRSYAINTILPMVKTFFESTLKVVQSPTGIVFSSSFGKCGYYGGVTLPKLNWPTSDYVLLMTARPTFGATIAWAGLCAEDTSTGRPVAGQANWGPAKMYPGDSSKLPSQKQVMIHEVSHALGFSSGSFTKFKDDAGQVWPETVVRKTAIYGGSTTHSRDFLATPRVKEWARAYFGCSTLPGAQLEDGGGSGTEGSHWEKRLFMNEYMTGTVSTRPVFTTLTMAAFADSGHYSVDYASSELGPLVWGRALGCSFAAGDCGSWPGLYSCTTASAKKCGADGLTRGSCNMLTYPSDRPIYYQHWAGQPRWGGGSELADYCAWYETQTDCQVSGNAPGDAATRGETYGSSSRCLESSVTSGSPLSAVDPRCYAFQCTSGNVLQVRIGSSAWYTCPAAGGAVVVGGGARGVSV